MHLSSVPVVPTVSAFVTSLPGAILATLAYYDQFDRPLTARELAERLIGREADEATIANELERSPRLQQGVSREGDYYVLAGRSDLVQRYLSLTRVRQEKWRRLERFARILQYVPFVRCVIAGGSLAKGSARAESDIDFVCLISTGRLWMARTIIAALCFLWNRARTEPRGNPGQDEIDLLTAHSLAGLENPYQTFYSALSMHEAVVLYDSEDAARRFAESNAWLRKYFPGFTLFRQADPLIRPHPVPACIKRSLEWILDLPPGAALEHRLYHWWRRRWQKYWAAPEWEGGEGIATPTTANFKSYYWETQAMSRFMERLRALGFDTTGFCS